MAAGKTHTDVVNHHLVKAARAKRALDDICNGLRSEDYKKGEGLESVGERIGSFGLLVGRRRGDGDVRCIPFWSRMSEPEILVPPRNRVPFLGCSNMDAMAAAGRKSVQL